MTLKRVVSWIRRHILRQKEAVKTIWGEFTPEKIRRLEHRRSEFERRIPDYIIQHRIESAKKRRRSLDFGKHMKHGKQAPWYRKSIKAKKKVEEED